MRSGDIWVEGSHEYRQFEEYLLPAKDWQGLRATGTPPVAVPSDFTTYLTERKTLLHEQLARVGQLLKDNALPDVRIDKNKVRITPLDAEIPEGGMATIRAKLGHLTELDMFRLSSYDTTATSLVIASNVQKWYTLTGTQSSIFVARWRVTAPNGLSLLKNRSRRH